LENVAGKRRIFFKKSENKKYPIRNNKIRKLRK
jgi:hypothetical protein